MEVSARAGRKESGPAPGRESDGLPRGRWRLYAAIVMVLVIVASFALRLPYLTADSPGTVTECGALLTDEGLYAASAIYHETMGTWYVEGGFNPIINVPVLQVLQVGFFKVLGYDIATLRVMIIFFEFILLIVLAAFVARFEGWLTALLAATILSVNHYYWIYSRLSIAEVPMLFFMFCSFVAAVYARGKWMYPLTALSGLLYGLCLLTKTSGVFVAPILGMYVVFHDFDGKAWPLKGLFRTWNWKPALIRAIVWNAVFFTVMGLYFFLVVLPFKADYEYFQSINVQVTSSLAPAHIYEGYVYILDFAREIDAVLYAVCIPVIFVLALLQRSYRRNHLLYMSIAWLAIYILMFAVYGRFYSRFFLGMLPAIAIWAAITMKYALVARDLKVPFKSNWRLPRFAAYAPAAAVGVILILSFAWNFARIYDYTKVTEYNYAKAAERMAEIMAADPDANNHVLGQLSLTISLHNGIIPVTDRYGLASFRERFEEQKPTYLISEGLMEVYPMEPWYMHREWIHDYYDLELVETFHIFQDYRGYNVHFYKLHPKNELAEVY